MSPHSYEIPQNEIYAETSVIDILQKFRQYGKMKGTFRGSNLAKESVYKLYNSLQDIMTPYLDTFWSYTKKGHNSVPIFEASKIDTTSIRCGMESPDPERSNALRFKSISTIAASEN